MNQDGGGGGGGRGRRGRCGGGRETGEPKKQKVRQQARGPSIEELELISYLEEIAARNSSGSNTGPAVTDPSLQSYSYLIGIFTRNSAPSSSPLSSPSNQSSIHQPLRNDAIFRAAIDNMPRAVPPQVGGLGSAFSPCGANSSRSAISATQVIKPPSSSSASTRRGQVQNQNKNSSASSPSNQTLIRLANDAVFRATSDHSRPELPPPGRRWVSAFSPCGPNSRTTQVINPPTLSSEASQGSGGGTTASRRETPPYYRFPILKEDDDGESSDAGEQITD